MDFSANHIGFVVSSYGLSFLLIAALTIRILVKDRKLRAEAERLDQQRRKART